MKISKDEIEEHLQEKAKDEIAKNKFMNSLMDAYSAIENTAKRVTDVVMTPELFSDFRKVFIDADFEHDRNKVIKGLMAYHWGISSLNKSV